MDDMSQQALGAALDRLDLRHHLDRLLFRCASSRAAASNATSAVSQ